MLLRANLGSKLLFSINYWGEKMPQKEKQMEKPEEKGCADAITVVLVYVSAVLH